MIFKELARGIKHLLSSFKRTYSQSGEDMIADFYLPDIKKGFYVDVGANHPSYLNNTYFFYKKGWRGLCIEPDKGKVGFLKVLRPKDKIENLAISNSKGQMPFYVFDPDTLSTLSLVEAEKYKNMGYKLEKVLQVPVFTLAEILKKNKPDGKIDLMSVDTEGHDKQVLESNDWVRFRPKIIILEVVEHKKDAGKRINKEFDEFMSSKNYYKLADTYINAIYIEGNYAQAKHLDF